MKIVAVTCGEPPNSNSGASTKVYFSYLNAILKRGWNLTLFCVGENEIKVKRKVSILADELSPALVKFIKIPNPFKIKKYGVTIDQISKYLTEQIENEKPDYVIAFDIESAALTRGITGIKKIVWLGDLRFLTTWFHYMLLPKNIFIKFFSVFSVLIRILSWVVIYKLSIGDAHKVIVSSHNSVRYLKFLKKKSIYIPYPWPINLKKIIKQPNLKPTFLFFGNLVGLGSVSAVNSIFGEIYNECLTLWGSNNFEILVSGFHELRPDLKSKLIHLPNLKLMGFVPKISTLLSRVDAVLVPIKVPVGNRSRVLTALAYGVPIIGHKNLAKGNPALLHKVNCLLYESRIELRSALILSIYDKKLVNRIATSGQKLYLQENNPRVACRLFLNELTSR